MNAKRINNLLFEAQRRDRSAFRDLFLEAAPVIAVRLAENGASSQTAEKAIQSTFVKIWKHETLVPFSPDQSGVDWLVETAIQEARETPSSAHDGPLVLDTDAVWPKVKKAAFDDTWWSVLRRLDILFAVIAAIIWAAIVYLLRPG